MKQYHYREFSSILSATLECELNQDWNVINIYPTGWRQEVCVIYYTTDEDRHLSQPQNNWKPSDEQMKALGVATNISNIPDKEYQELEKLYQDLKKLK